MLAFLALTSLPATAALPDLVQDGQRAEALAALEQGTDPNERSVDGTTALHWAIYKGDLALAQELLEAGADPGLANDYGATPLSTAALNTDTDAIRLLLEAGAEADAANADNETALMVVARSGNVEAARLLLEHGAKVNAVEGWGGQSALMWAVAHGHVDMARVLIEAGADVNARGTFHDWERHVTAEPRIKVLHDGGFTPLLYAAREGCLECVSLLVEAGADVNLPDPWDVTPLLLAVLNMNFDTAAALIELGADVQQWDWWGRTPLYAAIDLNSLPRGRRPDLPPADDHSGLDIARMLIERGAEVDFRLKKEAPPRSPTGDRGQLEGSTDAYVLHIGATPLHAAVKTGDFEAVRLLLEHGADVNMPNKIYGITPILAAAGVGHLLGNFAERPTRGAFKTDQDALAMVKLLQEAGADLHARDYRGFTAAHGAAEFGWLETLRYVHEQGVPVDAPALEPFRLLPGRSYLYSEVPAVWPEVGPDDKFTPRAIAEHNGLTDVVALIDSLTGATTP